MTIPTLTTARLTLRPYDRADFDAYAAFLADARATYMGGPYSRAEAWTWFTNDIASWPLYGFGSLAIEENGRLAGFAGLIYPPQFHEPECGWGLYDGFTGRGLATEAARAILAHTFATTTLTTVVSYIDRHNAASRAVAERLGGRLDPDAPNPLDGRDVVYRHTPDTLRAAA